MEFKVLVHEGKFVNEMMLGFSDEIPYTDIPQLHQLDTSVESLIKVNRVVSGAMLLDNQIELYDKQISLCEFKTFTLSILGSRGGRNNIIVIGDIDSKHLNKLRGLGPTTVVDPEAHILEQAERNLVDVIIAHVDHEATTVHHSDIVENEVFEITNHMSLLPDVSIFKNTPQGKSKKKGRFNNRNKKFIR